MWKWFNDKSLSAVFPNLNIANKIYLTLPSSSCTAEKAFSKLKRIKNKYRTTLTQEHLNSLIILSSENDILETINLDHTGHSQRVC